MPIDLSMKRFGQVFTKLRKFEVTRLILHTGLANIRHEKYSFECVKPNEYSNIRYIRFTTSLKYYEWSLGLKIVPLFASYCCTRG